MRHTINSTRLRVRIGFFWAFFRSTLRSKFICRLAVVAVLLLGGTMVARADDEAGEAKRLPLRERLLLLRSALDLVQLAAALEQQSTQQP